jgi:hypothetical protein
MKSNRIKTYALAGALCCLATFALSSCRDQEWSEDYDIEWPVTTIESIEPLQGPPGSILTVAGRNLDFTYIFRIGSFECEVLEKTATQLRVKVPEALLEESSISVYNLYRRTFEFEGTFTPVFAE